MPTVLNAVGVSVGSADSSTTPAFTSTAGSTISVVAPIYGTTTAFADTDVTDSKGNTYKLRERINAGATSPGIAIFDNVNGVRGATHTVTVNGPGTCTAANTVAIEIGPSAGFDYVGFYPPTANSGSDATSPYTVIPGGNFPSDNISISGVCLDSGTNNAFTNNAGYTTAHTEPDGTARLVHHVAYKIGESTAPGAIGPTSGHTVTAGRVIIAAYRDMDLPTMAVEKGMLTIPVSGGSVIQLPPNFNPKAIIAWMTNNTADASPSAAATFKSWGYGFATYRASTVASFNINGAAVNSDAAATDGAHMCDAIQLVNLRDSTGTGVIHTTSLTSMTTGVNSFVTLAHGATRQAGGFLHYLVLGGSDLTDAQVVNFDNGTGASTTVALAAGFGAPDLVGFCSASSPTNGTAVTADITLSLGWAIKDGAQAVVAWGSDDATTVVLACQHETGSCHIQHSIPPATEDGKSSLSASSGWGTDNFILTNGNPGSIGTRVGALALKGTFQKAISKQANPATAIDQDLTPGFTPSGAFFFSDQLPAHAGVDTTHANNSGLSVGGTDGNYNGMALIQDDDANAVQCARVYSDSKRPFSMHSQATTSFSTVAQSNNHGATILANTLRISWLTVVSQADFSSLILGSSAAAPVTTADVVMAASRF